MTGADHRKPATSDGNGPADDGPIDPSSSGPADPTGYGAALDELEDLLDDLERSEVDIDVLAERVARGVELIRYCRSRLEVVTADVDAIVAELAPAPDPPTDGAQTPSGAPAR